MINLLVLLVIAGVAGADAGSGSGTAAQSYKPTETFFLDCGGAQPSNIQGISPPWETDIGSKLLSPANPQNSSATSNAAKQDPSVEQNPYVTARIIHSKFIYTFPVSTGPKFVRLYFYPETYSGLKPSDSFFSVTANSYTLLSNFSAFLTVSAIDPPVKSFFKEFIINVQNTQILNITFTPNSNSFAFINGIEVVSMPDNLYQPVSGNTQIKFVGFNHDYNLGSTTSLERVYRLNVGGNFINEIDDTGMFRSWVPDRDYIFGTEVGTVTTKSNSSIRYSIKTPNYTAPVTVYETARILGHGYQTNVISNLTWKFSVDSGFTYLMRLHFCETLAGITREGQVLFYIFINGQTVETDADIIHMSGGNGIPVYRDYIILLTDGTPAKTDLILALRPNRAFNPGYIDVRLNGLEIFKMNNSGGSLAGRNPKSVEIPLSPENPQENGEGGESSGVIFAVIGGVVGGLILVGGLCLCVYRRRKRGKYSGQKDGKSWVPFSYTSKSTNTTVSTLPSDLCRRFSLAEIKAAVSNFDDKLVIGAGGFGNVYKGSIDGGSISVAIKRLNSSSKQGIREFQTEIEMLSKLRHLHLVSLIGYSEDDGEMILVYEFMSNGTLRDHLYKTENPSLSWKRRLQILIGSARGLHYLHTGTKQMIIHRDVKSTNILLDEKWVAKVSDFGLSKMGPTDTSNTHVSTVVKGSFGYVDPEYYRRQQLTEKSDVYSFGVVLFEVLCARPAIIQGAPKEQVSLGVWARNCYKRGTLDQIVDPNLRAEIAPESLNKFGEIATSCLCDNGSDRPTMSDLVWSLEFVLQLQETADKNKNGPDLSLKMNDKESTLDPTSDEEDLFSSDGVVFVSKNSETLSSALLSNTSDSDKMKSENVFSEIMDPKGR